MKRQLDQTSGWPARRRCDALGRAVALLALVAPLASRAEDEPVAPELSWSWNARALTMGQYRQLQRSAFLNPENAFARLPLVGGELDLRPDIFADSRVLSGMIKPRLVAESARIHGLDYATESSLDAYVNEWRLQLRPFAGLSTSVGRENIQWGPAMSLSLSNPFFFDNGRSNPYAEVPGKEFVRLTVLPGSGRVGLSLLANVGKGRDPSPSFDRTYAVKLDWTGENFQVSGVGSWKEGSRARGGGYAQVTASDALLLYAEGNLGPGSEALHPRRTEDGVGWTMARRGGSGLTGDLLVGAAYTFGDSSVLYLEYLGLYEGYGARELSDYFLLSRDVSEIVQGGGADAMEAGRVMGLAANPGLRMLGRHYLFLQYMKNGIGRKVDLVLRYTQSLERPSPMFVGILEWAATDRTALFGLAAVSPGPRDREFSQFQRLFVNFGVRINL